MKDGRQCRAWRKVKGITVRECRSDLDDIERCRDESSGHSTDTATVHLKECQLSNLRNTMSPSIEALWLGDETHAPAAMWFQLFFGSHWTALTSSDGVLIGGSSVEVEAMYSV